jgi:hypothetical protein
VGAAFGHSSGTPIDWQILQFIRRHTGLDFGIETGRYRRHAKAAIAEFVKQRNARLDS